MMFLRKKIFLKIFYLGFFLIFVLINLGCGKISNQNEDLFLKDITLGRQISQEPRLLDGTFVDPEKTNLIPVASIIDNFPNARPPAGLNSALVVYEVPVEAGITRFLAIFDLDSLPEKIGPIRSARPYLIELAEEYQSLFLHAGGSPEALEKLKSNDYQVYNIEAIGIDEKYFWRDPLRIAPFNLYISAKAIKNILKNKNIPEKVNFEPWHFRSSNSTLNKKTFEEIVVNYKEKIIWRYDPEKNIYLRFLQNGKPFLDENNQQIATKNLVLQKAKIETIDKEGRKKINLNGQGKAVIFKEGKKIEGFWKKERKRTKFYDQAGQEIEFIRGNTWIEIISDI
jgi:hypothetical protein